MENKFATVAPKQELVLTLEGIDPKGEPVVVTEVLPSGEVVEETLTETLPLVEIARTFQGLGRYQLHVQQGALEAHRSVCIVPPDPLKNTRIAFFNAPARFGDLHRFATTPPVGSLVSRPMNSAKRVVIEQERTQVVGRSTLVANLELEPFLVLHPILWTTTLPESRGTSVLQRAKRHHGQKMRTLVQKPHAGTLEQTFKGTPCKLKASTGSGVRQLFRQDGSLYIWIDQPEFPLVLPGDSIKPTSKC